MAVVTELVIDASKAKSGADQYVSEMGRSQDAMRRQMGALADLSGANDNFARGITSSVLPSLNQLALAVGALAGTTAVGFAAFQKLAGSIADIGSSARAAMTNIVEFQEITYAMSVSGVEADKTASSLKEIAKNLVEAGMKENDLSKFLDANGIKWKENGKVILSTADAFHIMADLVKKAENDIIGAKVIEKFGADAALLPGLLGGSAEIARRGDELIQLGGVIDDTIIAKATEFDRAWKEATAKVSVYFRAWLAEVIPLVDRIENIKIPADIEVSNAPVDPRTTEEKFSDMFGYLERLSKQFGDSVDNIFSELPTSDSIEARTAAFAKINAAFGQFSQIVSPELVGKVDDIFSTLNAAPKSGSWIDTISNSQFITNFESAFKIMATTSAPIDAASGAGGIKGLGDDKDKDKRDFWDRATDSISKHIARINADTLAVGQNVGVQEQLRSEFALLEAARQAGDAKDSKREKVTDDQIEQYRVFRAAHMDLGAAAALEAANINLDDDAFKKLTIDVGAAALAFEKIKIANQIDFSRKTAFLSPEDMQIAQQLKGIYGNDVPRALASSEASGMRLNNVLKGINDAAGTFASGFIKDIDNGVPKMDALANAAKKVAENVIDIATKQAVSGGLGALFGGLTQGGTQTAGASSAAGILTTAGATLAASMIEGATTAAAILTGSAAADAGTKVTAATAAGSIEVAAATTSGGVWVSFTEAAAAIWDFATQNWVALIAAAIAAAAVVFGLSKGESQSDKRAQDAANLKGQQLLAQLNGGQGSLADNASQLQATTNQAVLALGGKNQTLAYQLINATNDAITKSQHVFLEGWKGTLDALAAGLGDNSPFAQARSNVDQFTQSIKDFVENTGTVFGSGSGQVAQAQAAGREFLLTLLDAPKDLSATATELGRIQGTASSLQQALVDLGSSADEATKAISDGVKKAMDSLTTSFTADLTTRLNAATGKSFLNDITTLVAQHQQDLADAASLGLTSDLANSVFAAEAQKIVDDNQLVGQSYADLTAQYPDLIGKTHEYTQALTDQAAIQAKINSGASGVLDYINGLLSGQSSKLPPGVVLSNAQSVYGSNLALAQGNPADQATQDAISKFPSLADNLEKAASAFYGSSQGYQNIRSQIINQGLNLPTVQAATDPVVVALRDTIDAIKDNTTSTDTLSGSTGSANAGMTGMANILGSGTDSALLAKLNALGGNISTLGGNIQGDADQIISLANSIAGNAGAAAQIVTLANSIAGNAGAAAQIVTLANSIAGTSGAASQIVSLSDSISGNAGAAAQIAALAGNLTGDTGTVNQIKALADQISGTAGAATQIATLAGNIAGASGAAAQIAALAGNINGNAGAAAQIAALAGNIAGNAGAAAQIIALAGNVHDAAGQVVIMGNQIGDSTSGIGTVVGNTGMTADRVGTSGDTGSVAGLISLLKDQLTNGAFTLTGSTYNTVAGHFDPLAINVNNNMLLALNKIVLNTYATAANTQGLAINAGILNNVGGAFATGGVIPSGGLGLVSEHSPGGGRFIRAGAEPITVSPFAPSFANDNSGVVAELRSLRAEVAQLRAENNRSTEAAAVHVGTKVDELKEEQTKTRRFVQSKSR